MQKLKPLSFGELMDTAFLIFRKSYVHFLIMSGGAGLIIAIYQFWLFFQFSGVGMVAAPAGGFAQSVLIAVLGSLSELMTLALIGTLVVFTSAYYLGEPLSIRSSVAKMAGAYFALLGAALVGVVLTTVGFVLLIIPGVAVAVYLSFLLQAMLLEGIGPVSAIRRSFVLVRSRGFWAVFGLLLMAVLVVEGANIILDIPFSALGHFMWGAGARASALSHTLAGFVTTALFGAFPAILLTVAYFDAKVREEEAAGA